jgi:hypothetical protein
LTLVHVSDVPTPPVPAGWRAEVGGEGSSAVGLGDEGEWATFCPKVIFTLLEGRVGGGRAVAGLGDRRSIKFVETQGKI